LKSVNNTVLFKKEYKMKKQSATLFWVSEINLVLWVGLLGIILTDGLSKPNEIKIAKGIIVAGFIIAALLQHWAYHKIYKPIRKQEKVNRTKRMQTIVE